MRLTSSAFADGGDIPRQFTCDGVNQSPPLAWTGVPSGTVSLALQVQDIDTSQKFVHWLFYDDIKPTIASLAAGRVAARRHRGHEQLRQAGLRLPLPAPGGG